MAVIEVTDATLAVIRRVFEPAAHDEVVACLARECGVNLPFNENSTPAQLERIRFAVLKLSEGEMAKLREWVRDAQIDSRDVLMAAGFGYSVEEHRRWAKALLS